MLDELGIDGAHNRHEVGGPRGEAPVHRDTTAVDSRASHQPAEHVAASVVCGQHPGGDEKSRPPEVVGEHVERAHGRVGDG